GGRDRRGVRLIPLDRAVAHGILRPLRSDQEADRPGGGRRQRAHPRVVLAHPHRSRAAGHRGPDDRHHLRQRGAWHTVLMLSAGIATAVPLLLFAAGARRINLPVIGMIQFMTPIMQFLTGVLILHEPMPPERWIGFILVWIAVGVFVIDLLLATRSLAHRDPVAAGAP